MQKIKMLMCVLLSVIFLTTNMIVVFASPEQATMQTVANEELIEEGEIGQIEQAEPEHKDKTDKYIIKYKSGILDKELSKKTKNKLGAVKVQKGNAYGKLKIKDKGNGKNKDKNKNSEPGEMLFVEISEKLETEEFKSIIKANEDMSEIEYIQPDYELSLSDLVTGELEIDMSEETATEDVEGAEEQAVPDVSENSQNEQVSDEPTTVADPPDNVDSFNIEDSLNTAFSVSTGENVTIAIIDSIIDINHEQLADHLTIGWDFINDSELNISSGETVTENHGTHIAGIIAKCTPGSLIMPLKVFENGNAYTSDIIAAIEYADANGASIVNCSWGSSDENLALKEAMENSDMLFVAAAGNNRMNIDNTGIYPASYELDNIISVGSINNDGGMSYFSNYGLTVDITAWGREVESLLPNNGSGTMTGTSVSAAFVSGAAALVEAVSEENTDIREVLMNSSDKLTCLTGKAADGNKLNFWNAVNALPGTQTEAEPEDDFDVFGYQATPSENWDLFCSLDNVQVATGSAFTVVLKNDGTVWTFGSNYCGNLGNGDVLNRTVTSSSTPVQVVGLTNVVQIAAGIDHAIALKDDGTVWAWGENGGVSYANVAIQISGFSNIDKIAAGGYNSAVIDNNGLMTIIDSWSYARTFTSAEQVALGVSFCIVLNTSGDVYACGYNGYGQLGLGNTINRTTFTHITGLSNITDIYATYDQAAAIDASGNLKTWGKNNAGQLGIGNLDNQLIPLNVPGMESVDKVALGEEHTLALTSDGKVWAWGDNSKGQLGIGTLDNSTTPVSVNNIGSFNTAVELTAGQNHSAVIDESAKVYCFGDNMYGQIGDGVPLVQTKPALATLAQGMTEFSVGSYENYGLREDGTVWKIDSALTQVKNLPYIETISNRLAVDEDGYVWEWSDDLQAEKIEEISNIKSVSQNGYHSMALSNDGTVYCWGDNDYGQLGNGTVIDSDVPVEVTAISNVDQISAGLESSLARVGGTVYEWGRRAFVEYEYNPDTGEVEGPLYDDVPVQVAGISNAVSIASGTYHDLILKSDGKTYQWGYSAGDYSGSFTSVDTTNPNTIGAGFGLNVAVRPNVNHIFQWGNTSFEQWMGEFYDASNNASRVIMPSTVDKVFVGDYYIYAITDDGNVYSWGSNLRSLLGNVRKQHHTLPSIVNGITNLGTENDYHELSLGDTINGAITTEGTSDFYSFTAPIEGDYIFSIISDDNVEMKIYVYVPIGGLIELDADAVKNRIGLNAYESIYIEIHQPNNKKGKYILSVEGDGDIKEIDIQVHSGKKINLVVTIQNMPTNNSGQYTINYEPSEIDLEDLCALTYTKELSAGTISGPDIEIISVNRITGEIVFSNPNQYNCNTSKVLNVIGFVGLVSEPQSKISIE
ncbi:MAG: S8 family serine peptidase [Eubacteriales bacterium]|nr:S8 family serine peptidase [Eubacteriales bacterium]